MGLQSYISPDVHASVNCHTGSLSAAAYCFVSMRAIIVRLDFQRCIFHFDLARHYRADLCDALSKALLCRRILLIRVLLLDS